MRAGVHWPYDVPHGAPEETWRLADLAQPEILVIMSHTPEIDYQRLYERYPDALWVIRAKTGPGNRGSWLWHADGTQSDHILDYAEWGLFSEHTLRDALQFLTNRGITPYVQVGCEPRLELATNGDDVASVRSACHWLVEWWYQQYQEIHDAYPTALVAAPPLDQGWPAMTAEQMAILAPLYGRADWISEHCYTNGGDYDDPEWGGRWRGLWRTWYPSKPVIITEINDNGQIPVDQRATHIAGYLEHLRRQQDELLLGAVNFILPGGSDDDARRAAGKGWWLLTESDCLAWRDASLLAMTPATPDPPIDPIAGGSETMTDEQALEACLTDIWQAATGKAPKDVMRNPDAALAKYWREHIRDMVAPVGPERPADSGAVYQAFVGGVLKWTPDAGVEQAA